MHTIQLSVLLWTIVWLCLLLGLGLPEQAIDYPLGLGLVVEDEVTEFHDSLVHKNIQFNN